MVVSFKTSKCNKKSDKNINDQKDVSMMDIIKNLKDEREKQENGFLDKLEIACYEIQKKDEIIKNKDINLNELKAENQKRISDFNTLNNKQSSLLQNLNELKAENNTLNKNQSSLLQNLNELKAENNKFISDYKTLKNKQSSSLQNLDKQKILINELQFLNSQLTKENNELKNKENKSRKELKQAKNARNLSTESLKICEQNTKSLQDELSKNNKILKQNKKEIQSLIEEKTSLDVELKLFKKLTKDENNKKDSYLSNYKAIAEVSQKNFKDCEKAKEILICQLRKETDINQKKDELIKQNDYENKKLKKNLLEEIANLKKEIKKKDNDIKLANALRKDSEENKSSLIRNNDNNYIVSAVDGYIQDDCELISNSKNENKYKNCEFVICDDFDYSNDNSKIANLYKIKECEFKYFSFLAYTLDKNILQEILKSGKNICLNRDKTLIKNFITEYAYSDKYEIIINELIVIKKMIDDILYAINKLIIHFNKINLLQIEAFTNLNDTKDDLNSKLETYIQIMNNILDTVCYNQEPVLKTTTCLPFKLSKSYNFCGCHKNLNITLVFPSMNRIFNNCINFSDSSYLVKNITILANAKCNLLIYFSNMNNYNLVLSNIIKILKIKLHNIDDNYMNIREKFLNCVSDEASTCISKYKQCRITK